MKSVLQVFKVTERVCFPVKFVSLQTKFKENYDVVTV